MHIFYAFSLYYCIQYMNDHQFWGEWRGLNECCGAGILLLEFKHILALGFEDCNDLGKFAESEPQTNNSMAFKQQIHIIKCHDVVTKLIKSWTRQSDLVKMSYCNFPNCDMISDKNYKHPVGNCLKSRQNNLSHPN